MTSIVFDESCDAFTQAVGTGDAVNELGLPENIQGLRGLRILKNRENGDEPQTQNIVGRTSGMNIRYEPVLGLPTYTYDDYTMRRKAGVVMSYNKHQQTQKSSYAYFASSGKSKYRSMTNARIKALKESQQCLQTEYTLKKASNSGVYGDTTSLIYRPEVPFYSSL